MNIQYLVNTLLLFALLTTTIGRPNIIVFVADDLGWNDLSFHGSRQIPTPNLDALARSGIILNNYYVCPVCSPSRGALMTGLYPIHTGLQHEVIFVDEPWGLPLNVTLLPEYLQRLGYSTHAVGKWHLGFYRKEYTPTFRGFDSHYGYWSGKEDYFDHTQQMGRMWGLDFHENMRPVTDAIGKYSTFLFRDRAIKLIRNHNTTNPLFLYVAFQSVHSANSYAPLQAPTRYIKRFSHIKDPKRRVFAAMVSAMDDSVGAIVSALDRRGLLRDSVLVFTTDNGGPAAGFNDNAASNWPLRGVKATLWEGGVRGVAFVRSPALRASGRTSTQLMHVSDWLPTLYSAAGGDVSSLGSLDGHDLWSALSSASPSPRTEVLLNIDDASAVAAVRVGDYKLVQGSVYGGEWDGWYGPSGRKGAEAEDLSCGPRPANASEDCRPARKPCVFDVANDPCEYRNLAEEKPEVLSMLLKRLSAYNATAVQPGNRPADPLSNPKYYNYRWVNWMDYLGGHG